MKLFIYESFEDGLNARIIVSFMDGDIILDLPADASWYDYEYSDDIIREQQFCVPVPTCLSINATSNDSSSQLTWTLEDLNGTVNDPPATFAVTADGDLIEGECTLSPTTLPPTLAPSSTLTPNLQLPACFNMTLYDANGQSWSRGYYRVKRDGETIISAADMIEDFVQYDVVCIDLFPACIAIDIVSGDIGLGGEEAVSWVLGDGFYHGGPPPNSGEYTYEFYLIGNHELVNGSCTQPPTSESPTLAPTVTAYPTISPQPSAVPTTAFPSASPLAQMCFNLTMTDAIGDTWNGAYYYVETIDNEELATGTMPISDVRDDQGVPFVTKTICIVATTDCLVFRVTEGFFDEEVGWYLGDGAVSGGAPDRQGFEVLPSGEVVGCTLPDT